MSARRHTRNAEEKFERITHHAALVMQGQASAATLLHGSEQRQWGAAVPGVVAVHRSSRIRLQGKMLGDITS